jgi:hypothetical protein
VNGGGALRFSNVRYVRLYLANGGGANFVPEIGELILGRRRQLEYKPNRPFGSRNMSDIVETSETMGGILHKTIFARRRFVLDANFLISSTTYASDVIAFYQNCRGPFVWIYDPTTYPNEWNFMFTSDSDFEFNMNGPNVYDFNLKALEQGPDQFFLDNEL